MLKVFFFSYFSLIEMVFLNRRNIHYLQINTTNIFNINIKGNIQQLFYSTHPKIPPNSTSSQATKIGSSHVMVDGGGTRASEKPNIWK